MLLTKEVEVRPRGLMIKYYRDRGYDAKYQQSLMVKVQDLSDGSEISVDVLCDYCKETICHPAYRDYCKRIEQFGDYVCSKCRFEHQKEACLINYGTYVPSKSEKIKEKIRNTNIERYGHSNPMQSSEVRAKVNKTLCKNGTQKTSKQQLYLHSLYGGELNYAIKYYATDICFSEEKLIIEYDGGGHDLRVTLGSLTQEEFEQKEIIRNKILKTEGYKRVNIVSKSDLLPSDAVLIQMLSDARNYFTLYPNHSWIEFNISTSTIRNAENPQSIPYSFGTLRTIKDSDINIV